MKKSNIRRLSVFILVTLIMTGCTSEKTSTSSPSENAKEPILLQSQAMPTTNVNYGYMVEVMKATENFYKDKYKITVVEGSGSEDCIRALHSGLVEMGQTDLITAWQAYEGKAPFDGDPVSELRGLVVKLGSLFQFAVSEDSGIDSIWDLEGQPYVVGGIGSGSESQINELFGIVGIKPDLKRANLPDAKAMYADRQIIGFQITDSGLKPTPAFVESQSTRPVKILPFDDKLIEGFLSVYPFAIRSIKPDVYPWIHEEIKSLAGVSGMSCTDKMSPQVAYDITKAYWETNDIWGKSYPEQVVPIENVLTEMTIPLHPGAIKYYEECGLTIPDKLIPPEGKWDGK